MSKRNVIVIAYTAPGPEWDTVRQHAAQVKAVVFNPHNGVGASKDAGYAALREEMRDLGCLVAGYVYTASGPIDSDDRVYSNRNPAEIIDEVRRWKDWYSADAIFFDECATSADKVPYGRRIVGTTRSVIPDAFVTLNFGTIPDRAWADIDAVMCVTETSQSNYATKQFPDWMRTMQAGLTDPGRTLDIVYGVTDIAAVMARFAANSHDYVYLTDVPGPNPQYAVDRSLWPPAESPAPPPVPAPPATARMLSTCSTDQLLEEVRNRIDK